MSAALLRTGTVVNQPTPRLSPCLRSAIMSFVGLGSVSDYVVHHTEAPVIVVKQQ